VVRRLALRVDGLDCPKPGRLPRESAEAVMAAHDAAVSAGRQSYLDPTTRLTVFTARFLADRNYCCGSGCRHCPYVDP
jgi:hypothetical protein